MTFEERRTLTRIKQLRETEKEAADPGTCRSFGIYAFPKKGQVLPASIFSTMNLKD